MLPLPRIEQMLRDLVDARRLHDRHRNTWIIGTSF
jgi:hypothetical protein